MISTLYLWLLKSNFVMVSHWVVCKLILLLSWDLDGTFLMESKVEF